MKNLARKIYSTLIEKYLFLRHYSEIKTIKSYLIGKGAEIGPGSNPFLKNATYIEKFPLSDQREYLKLDADNLIGISDQTFDYIFSAHCLEHLPDTIKTLNEWSRVLKDNGFICVILPHLDRTFDKGRKRTSLEHFIEDNDRKTNKYDQAHLSEFEEISLSQAEPDWLNNKNAYESSGDLNFKWMADTGRIHYHTFDQDSFIELAKYLGFSVMHVLETCSWRTDSFCVILKKVS